MSEKHLTPKQIADLTSLNVETIRRLCRKSKKEGGIAPIVIIGNRILVPESTYQEFMESHTVKAGSGSCND